MQILCLFSVNCVQEMNGIADIVDGLLESFGSGMVRILCVTKTGAGTKTLCPAAAAGPYF